MGESDTTGILMRLTVVRGATTGKEFVIEEGSNLIGRWDPDEGAFPEIDLEGEDEESKVSRKHAVILRQGAHVVLEDIGSRNGTYLNRGTRLVAGEQHVLTSGDEIVVGKTVLRFDIAG